MAQIMNGRDPFIHPVTQVLIGPYEFYEGFGHTEHEKTLPAVDSKETEVAEEAEQSQAGATLPERLVKSAEKYGIDVAGKTEDEVKEAVQEAAKLEKEAKLQAAKAGGAGGNGEAK